MSLATVYSATCKWWNVGPLLFMLLDIDRKWNTLWSRLVRGCQSCSMAEMSVESAGHVRTEMFPASRDCAQILETRGRP